MSEYSPIVYVWIEVHNPPGTKAQFMLARYLGGDVRSGTGEVRSHIFLSDTDIITYREPLPHTLSDVLSVIRAYAEAVHRRILDHVVKVLRDRNDEHEKKFWQEINGILDGQANAMLYDEIDDMLDEANK